MTGPDFINGVFETIGGAMILMHCRRLYIDKQVKGVSTFATAVFSLWGLWNLYYYPHLDQWLSFAGGVVIVVANLLWLSLMFKYRERT